MIILEKLIRVLYECLLIVRDVDPEVMEEFGDLDRSSLGIPAEFDSRGLSAAWWDDIFEGGS